MTSANKPQPRGGRRRRSALRAAPLLSTILFGPIATAHAQASSDPAADAAIDLPTVRVEGRGAGPLADTQGCFSRRDITGTKPDTPLSEIPQSVSVINREQLDSRQVQSLGEALRYTPGVQAETFGADPHVDFFSIRGFSTNDTGIYLNGLRVSPGVTALAPEPYGVERIDVLKGPASVLYGQNAPGGLVNLVSKRPTDAAFRDLTLLGGSYGRVQGQFDLGGPVGTDGTWSYRLTGLARGAGSQTNRVPNDRLFLAPAITYRIGPDTTVTLLTSFQNDHSAGQQFLPSEGTVFGNPNGRIPSRRFTGEDQYNKVDKFQMNLGYEVEHRFNEVFTVRQNARFSRIDYGQRQVYGVGFEPDLRTLNRSAYGQDVRANIYAVDTQGQARFATDPLTHTVLGGFEYNRITNATVNRSALATPLDVFRPAYGALQPELSTYVNSYQSQNLYGLYLQDQIKLDRFILTVGGRQDWVDTTTRDRLTGGLAPASQDDRKFTYRVGLGYEAPFGITPYVGYARSFQPVAGVNASGAAYQPTQGKQIEVGVKYQPPGMASFITAAAFDLRQTNVSTPDPTNVVNTLQTGEIRVRGFEVEAQANLLAGLNLLAAYTYLDPTVTGANDGTRGNQVGGVPRNAASGWVDYAFQEGSPAAGLSFGAGVRYVSSTQASNFNLFKVRDRTLADAALRYAIGRAARGRARRRLSVRSDEPGAHRRRRRLLQRRAGHGGRVRPARRGGAPRRARLFHRTAGGAVLSVSSDRPDTDFAVKLVDVAPDGTAHILADTILRARYRDGSTGRSP